MSGILDVAKAAGVSPSTVSRALRGLPGVSEATRAAVRAAADHLSYFPSPTAAALPTGRTNAIGVLVPWISRWFYTAVIDGAQSVVAGRGYDLLLYAVGARAAVPQDTWDVRSVSKRVDGVLALSVQLSDRQIEWLQSSTTPMVSVGPTLPGFCTVNIDDVDVGRTAARHLIGLGHRSIGFAGGEVDEPFGAWVIRERLAGSQQVLAEVGTRIEPEHRVPSDFSVDGGVRAFRRFAQQEQLPTAIIAASDEIAIGLIHAARAAGRRVPDDLSVIGVDGHDMAEIFGLSTVSQPVRDEGRVAAELLFEGLGGTRPSPPRLVTLPTTLIVRASTGPVGVLART